MSTTLRVVVDARILDTPGQERVGVGRYALEATRALSRARPEWSLAVLSNRIDLFPAELDVHATRWPTQRAAGRVAWLHMGAWVDRVAAGADAWFGTAFTLPIWWRKPAVVTIHDLMFVVARSTYSHGVKARYASWATHWAARQADRIVCGSQETRDLLREHWQVDSSKVVVAPYGVSECFGPSGPVATKGPQPYLLFVGTFEPRKGIATLHAALRQVNRSGVRAHLVLAGRYGWGVERTVAELRRDPAVRVHEDPTDAELAALYRGALATVYPSSMEGFGLPVAEAMASGSPVIASDLRCIREFAGGAPLYAAPGDSGALAAHIETLLGSATVRGERRESGLRAAEQLRWDVVGERIAEAIETAVSTRYA